MGFDLAKALATAAPTLAAMLGGPLAGTAVAALEQAFGLTPGGGSGAVADVIAKGALTPEAALALRQADQAHAERLEQMQIDLVKLNADAAAALSKVAAEDRASARAAAVLSGTAGRIFALSIVLLIVCLGGELVLLFGGVPKSVPDLVLGRVLGLLDAATLMVLGYHYGTSAGSDRKTELLTRPSAGKDGQ